MALFKLTQYRLEGGSWPSNADISFRLVGQPIGPNLASNPCNQWNNCPGSSSLNFNGTVILQIYVDGIFRGVACGVNDTPTPRTNLQGNFNTGFGIARAKFNVL